MNARKTLIGSVIAIAGIAAVSTSVLAARDGGWGGDRAERMIERVSERLELDDGQRASLDSLATEMQQTRELMRGDGDLRDEFRNLVTAETFDQSEALSLIEVRTTALQSQAPELVAAAAVFLDGLSAEQKADVESFLDRAGKRHRHD